MANAFIATTIFLGALMVAGALCRQIPKRSFWKLAAKLPGEAYDWILNDPAWMIVEGAPPNPRREFVGPFTLVVPQLGRKVTLYGRRDQIKNSKRGFVALYAHEIPSQSFPVFSSFALLVPMTAMLRFSTPLAAVNLILGDGITYLGYLMGAASIVPGHFWVLGLEDRLSTLFAAVAALGIGLFLSHVAF